MDALGRVRHDDEQGRPRLRLRHEIEARRLATEGRRRVGLEDFLEEAVQLARGDALHVARVHLLHQLEQRGDAAAGGRRQLVHRRIRRERELVLRFLFRVREIVLLREIDLVEADDHAAPAIDREPQDLRVLLGHALARVAHQNDHVAPLDGADRVQHADGLDEAVLFGDLRFAANSRGVDQHELLPVALDHRVDRVARGAGTIVDQHAIFAGDAVDERRLAGVGPTDDRDAHQRVVMVGTIEGHLGRQRREDRRLELAEAAPVKRRDAVQLVDAEPVEIGRFGLGRRRVGLVGDEEHRLLAATQQLDRALVGRGEPRHRVEHADDDVGLGDRQLDLAGDALLHRIVALGVEAAGVDQRVTAAAEPRVGVVAVTRDARLVVDDGELLPHETVEEGALPDVGSAHHGHDGPGTVLLGSCGEGELFLLAYVPPLGHLIPPEFPYPSSSRSRGSSAQPGVTRTKSSRWI